MEIPLWTVICTIAGFLVRVAQEHRFFSEYRLGRRRQVEVAVDVDRILGGFGHTVLPSPLIRQYLQEKAIVRERIINWWTKNKYQAQHRATGLSTAQRIMLHTPTMEMAAITGD